MIDVIRDNGKNQQVSTVYDIVPGDIVRISEGDLLPADGVLVCGKSYGVTCDQSSITGRQGISPKGLKIQSCTLAQL